LDETPQEELDKMIAEVDAQGFQGPTVEEYMNSLNPNYNFMKGAELFKEEFTKRLTESTYTKEELLVLLEKVFTGEE
jgi:hypothetical protein